jgi:anaerobic selenocysteine-containing dehydrogenase
MPHALSRRDLIAKSLATAAAFAAGLRGPNVLAQSLRKEPLDLTPNDVCTPTCKSTTSTHTSASSIRPERLCSTTTT